MSEEGRFTNSRLTGQEINSTFGEPGAKNSIELADLPAVALAAAEDYEETIIRLDEWIVSIEGALEPSS